MGKVAGENIVGAGLEVIPVAPGVTIECEKVDYGGIFRISRGSASEVVPCVQKNRSHISGGVSDWDLAFGVLCDIVLEVSSNCLHNV